jgi:hypothetical protein
MPIEVTVPPGYTRVEEPGATIVVRQDAVADIVAAYRAAPRDRPTLHGFAGRAPAARPLLGRQIAWAISLPVTGRAVVVRHNRHGGALRALTGDLFLSPTRAPFELDMALALETRGIRTPAIIAYAVYPAVPGFARSDVVTAAVPDSVDFGALLLQTSPGSPERGDALRAVNALLSRLAATRVRHHDLNVKNVLLQQVPASNAAWLLDVDRVQLDLPEPEADAANRARLHRSMIKWRDTRGARVSDAELEGLLRTATSTR